MTGPPLLLPMEAVYADWGHVEMRISEDYRNSVGFIVHGVNPVGTFFLLQFQVAPPEAGIRVGAIFIVTARHCVEGHEPCRVRYRGSVSNLSAPLGPAPEWDVDQWYFPKDKNIDLAVAVYEPPADIAPPSPKALPAEYSTPAIGRNIDLGELAYYVGLWRVSAVKNRGSVPLVRSATIAAFGEREITRVDSSGKPVGTWPSAHLIDTRSRQGFSGGPVFVQKLITRKWKVPWPIPPSWAVRARKAGTENMGEVTTFTDLWGLFLGYAEADGIGVVLPIEDVLAFFGSGELRAVMDEEKRKKWDERPDPDGAQAMSADDEDTTERDNFTDLLRKLAQVPKSEVDELRRRERGED